MMLTKKRQTDTQGTVISPFFSPHLTLPELTINPNFGHILCRPYPSELL